MPKSISEILQNDILTEDVKTELTEAFEQRIVEERERLSAELREEFANRYETDKVQIVEAMDAMLGDVLKKELNEFAEDKKIVAENKAKYKKAISEHKKIVNKFVTETLVRELTELRKDIKSQNSDIKVLENFVVEKLTSEINEFYDDKRSLVEQKVRMIQDGKKIVKEAKQKFIRKSASQLGVLVERVLTEQVKNLYEDIRRAKENEFGRKLFETFAGEFMSSTLCQGTQVGKLMKELQTTKVALSESKKKTQATNKALMESKRDVKVSRDIVERKTVINELLSPLNKNQKEVMKTLLETVRTANLRKSYDKYLSSVLAEGSAPVVKKEEKVTLTEGNIKRDQRREINGDKKNQIPSETGVSDEIIHLRKLAGNLK